MIQRIQTLYLLLVAACVGGALHFPWGSFFTPDGKAYSFEAFSVMQQVGQGAESIHFWALGAVLVVCGLSALVAIFCFKKRMLQSRFCIFNLVAFFGFYLCWLIFLLIEKGRLDASFGFHFGAAFPLLAGIFDFLALNAILRDEGKARAYERIR